MKVLLIDNVTDGHHMAYATSLHTSQAYESVLAMPKEEFTYLPHEDINGFRLGNYLRWVRRVKRLVKEVKPDVIHFLDGNPLVNYMGIGLSFLKRYKTVITYHLYFGGKRKEFGHKRLAKLTHSVVHTKELASFFQKFGPVTHIEYPNFLMREEKAEGRKGNILALGQTRYEKGLDLLLEALKGVKEEFTLTVAGAVGEFDEAYIREHTKSYAEQTEITLRYLSEEEVHSKLKECSIVVLPYRNSFDGASGPLTEGVGYRKCIIGPKGGSLGQIIREHHLGYTFEGENVPSLQMALEEALTSSFAYDEKAEAYRSFLSPERFRQQYADLYKSL